jgi:hypothetical protein
LRASVRAQWCFLSDSGRLDGRDKVWSRFVTATVADVLATRRYEPATMTARSHASLYGHRRLRAARR